MSKFPITGHAQLSAGDSGSDVVQMYFSVWQASRAAIEIELPSKEGQANLFCEVYSCDMVHEALSSCGLKVKS